MKPYQSGDVILFRLQSTADARLRAYVANGEVLDMDPRSFGGIGVIAVEEMARFYRHVLIKKRFPYHTAVALEHAWKSLFEAFRMMGVEDISFNQSRSLHYPGENPFDR